MAKSQQTKQSARRVSAGTKDTPAPDYRYDLIKHVRTIHFTLIATCFALLAASLFPKQSVWGRAWEQLLAVKQLINLGSGDIIVDKVQVGDIITQKNSKTGSEDIYYIKTKILKKLEENIVFEAKKNKDLLNSLDKAQSKIKTKVRWVSDIFDSIRKFHESRSFQMDINFNERSKYSLASNRINHPTTADLNRISSWWGKQLLRDIY